VGARPPRESSSCGRSQANDRPRSSSFTCAGANFKAARFLFCGMRGKAIRDGARAAKRGANVEGASERGKNGDERKARLVADTSDGSWFSRALMMPKVLTPACEGARCAHGQCLRRQLGPKLMAMRKGDRGNEWCGNLDAEPIAECCPMGGLRAGRKPEGNKTNTRDYQLEGRRRRRGSIADNQMAGRLSSLVWRGRENGWPAGIERWIGSGLGDYGEIESMFVEKNARWGSRRTLSLEATFRNGCREWRAGVVTNGGLRRGPAETKKRNSRNLPSKAESLGCANEWWGGVPPDSVFFALRFRARTGNRLSYGFPDILSSQFTAGWDLAWIWAAGKTGFRGQD